MSDKKNLDRLFQEKFKDFEFEPNEQVWKNIEAALKEDKKDRKGIPFWWRLSGIAAALIIGFFVLHFIYNSDDQQNGVVIEQNDNNIKNDSKDAIVKQSKNSESLNSIKLNLDKINNTDLEEKVAEANTKTTNSTIKNNQSKASLDSKNPVSIDSKKTQKNNNGVASQSHKKAIKNAKRARNQSVQNGAIAYRNLKNKKSKTNKTDFISNKVIANTQEVDKKPIQNETAIAIINNNRVKSEIIKNDLSIESTLTAKSEVAIANETIDNNKLDSAAIATVVPNALEELLKENEKEKKIAETNLNRWQITTNVAPIYFSSTSKGSPIHTQFSENDKKSDNNLSFGVGVNYAVNKKLSVRTGINKLNMDYNTNDVVFYAGLGARGFSNITPSGNATFIEVMNNQDVEASSLLPFENGLQDLNQGAIHQRMGYIELPVEMSYQIIDKKFGVILIGGMSTLFLNENEITVLSPGVSASLGSANNLNEIHFSSNIGIGFKYSFWKAFEMNFEPMFKYQINTFSKESGNFKPYFVGLYSGLSFKF